MSEKTVSDTGVIRTFEGGATRDTAADKHDIEGFLSPLALHVYCAYMHKHRTQSDGSIRDSDNWQSGFGLSTVLKSAWRHLRDWWTIHRGYPVFEKGERVDVQDAVCGVIFNAFCYLHEMEVGKLEKEMSGEDQVDQEWIQKYFDRIRADFGDSDTITKAAGETA